MSEVIKNWMEKITGNFDKLNDQVSDLESQLKNATTISETLKNEFLKVSSELNELKDSDLTKEIQDLKDRLENTLRDLPDSLKDFLSENSWELLREITWDFWISLTLVLNWSITDSNELKINEYKDEIKSLWVDFDFSETEENNKEIWELNIEKESYKWTPKESEINSNILKSKKSLLEKFQSLDKIIKEEKEKIKNTKTQMWEYLDSLKEVLKERFNSTFDFAKVQSMLWKFNLSSLNSAKNMQELNSAFDWKINELKNIDKKILKNLEDKFNEINEYNEDENWRYFWKFNNYINTLKTQIDKYKEIINKDRNYEFYFLEYSKKRTETKKVLDWKKEIKTERVVKWRKQKNETSQFTRWNRRLITQDSTLRNTKDQIVYDKKTEYLYKDKEVEKEWVSDFVKEKEEWKKDLTSAAFENIKNFEKDLENKEKIFNWKVEDIKNQINNFNFSDWLKNYVEAWIEDWCCEDLLNNIKLLFDNIDYVKEYLWKQSISNDKSFEIFEDIFKWLNSNSLDSFREEKNKNASFKDIFDTIVKNIKEKEESKEKEDKQEEETNKDNNPSEETDKNNLDSNEWDLLDGETIEESSKGNKEENKEENKEDLDDEWDIIDTEVIKEDKWYNFPNVKSWSEFENPEEETKAKEKAKQEEKINEQIKAFDKIIKKAEWLSKDIDKKIEEYKWKLEDLNKTDIKDVLSKIENFQEELQEEINWFKSELDKLKITTETLKNLWIENIHKDLKEKEDNLNEKIKKAEEIFWEIELKIWDLEGIFESFNTIKIRKQSEWFGLKNISNNDKTINNETVNEKPWKESSENSLNIDTNSILKVVKNPSIFSWLMSWAQSFFSKITSK